MKKKNLLYTLYSAVFVGICLVPAVTMPFTKTDGTAENRTLSQKPSLKTADGAFNTEFFSEFDTYFSEHFGLRQRLVTLDGRLRAELVGTSSNADVIVGRDGWLFYGDTADDFTNTNTLTERAVNNICRNLELMDEFCTNNGASFLFVTAPNKNSVYPEFMPKNYIETDREGNYEKLLRVMSERDEKRIKMYCDSQRPPGSYDSIGFIPFVDLRETLLNEKKTSDTLLYHKTDTHWNNAGALTARNAILGAYPDKSFDDFSDALYYPSNDWSGDLAEMIYPSDEPSDMQINYGIDFSYQYLGRFKGFDDITIKTTCEGADGDLLMYRDSYGEAILPFMAESFASAEFTRTVPYRGESILNGTADTVILEIVERNLGNLQKYAPMMPAPERDLTLMQTASANSEIFYKDANSYHQIYGIIGDSVQLSDASNIYVKIGDTAYEAYNCFEDTLLGMEGQFSDRGFSLYIPKSDANEPFDINTVTVLICTEKN